MEGRLFVINKRRIGQLVLLAGVLMIILAGSSIWFHFMDTSFVPLLFILSLVFIGAGAVLIKQSDEP